VGIEPRLPAQPRDGDGLTGATRDATRGEAPATRGTVLRISFDRLWLWIAVSLPAFLALVVPMPAVDLAYQVRAGDEILAAGAIPAVDTWTFSVAGTPWVDQQWLAQVVLFIGHAIGGWELLAVLRAGLVVAAVGLMLATALARGATPRTAAILALAGFAIAVPALALRPQLFGIVLFALLVWLVAIRESHPRALLVAPVVVLVWANLHGSFVLGPAILAYACLADIAAHRPWRVSLAVFAVAALATLVNPFGIGAWAYAANIGTNPAIANEVSEWQRTALLGVPGILFYPSVAVVLVLMVRRRTRFALPDWLLVGGVAALGAWAVRGVAWWPFVLVFLAAAALAPAEALYGSRPHRAPKPILANGVIAAVLGLLVVAALPWWRPPDPLTGRQGLLAYAPSGLAAVVAGLPPGSRAMIPQTWASFFEWAAPDALTFIDSRFELFPASVWADYDTMTASDAAARSATLDRWRVDVLVLPAGAEPPGAPWRAAGGTADGTVYVRP
jgi:hypothetical protein